MLELLLMLFAFGCFWLLVVPRCCVPCCCHLPSVPHPCPVGDCSCKNPKLLDYPLMIVFSADGWIRFIGTIAAYTVESESPRVLRVQKVLRALAILWVILSGVGVATGWIKYKMMRDGLPTPQVTPTQPSEILGQPVVVAPSQPVESTLLPTDMKGAPGNAKSA